jgi:hypothetical protein
MSKPPFAFIAGQESASLGLPVCKNRTQEFNILFEIALSQPFQSYCDCYQSRLPNAYAKESAGILYLDYLQVLELLALQGTGNTTLTTPDSWLVAVPISILAKKHWWARSCAVAL